MLPLANSTGGSESGEMILHYTWHCRFTVDSGLINAVAAGPPWRNCKGRILEG